MNHKHKDTIDHQLIDFFLFFLPSQAQLICCCCCCCIFSQKKTFLIIHYLSQFHSHQMLLQVTMFFIFFVIFFSFFFFVAICSFDKNSYYSYTFVNYFVSFSFKFKPSSPSYSINYFVSFVKLWNLLLLFSSSSNLFKFVYNLALFICWKLLHSHYNHIHFFDRLLLKSIKLIMLK